MVIGITGGIGSGKSTVCRLLEEQGAHIFYADLEARELMQSNPEVREQLEDVFGPDAWLPDGTLNRPWLASRIFGSDALREKVNSIVHPAVRTAFRQFREAAEQEGAWLIAREAALLLESGTDDLDLVVVVDAPEDVRIERVLNRDNTSAEAVRQRMRAQLKPGVMRDRADFVLSNGGSHAALQHEVDRLVRFLRNSGGPSAA